MNDTKYIELEKITEFDTIVEKANDEKKKLIIDFYGVWCRPCKEIAPSFEKASELSNHIFLKINADKFYGLLKHFHVKSLPTFIVIDENKVTDQFIGGNIDKFNEFINKNCN